MHPPEYLARVDQRHGDSPMSLLAREKSFRITNAYETDYLATRKMVYELTGGETPSGIVIAVPGKIDRATLTIMSAGQLKGFVRKPVAQRLRQDFGCHVVFRNDAEVAGLGEAFFGAAQDLEKFCYFTASSGFGGCLLVKINGVWHVIAGEPGHQRIGYPGVLCGCGQASCVEACCGGMSIEKLAGNRPPEMLSWKEYVELALRPMAVGVHNAMVFTGSEVAVMGGGQVLGRLGLPKAVQAEVRRLSKMMRRAEVRRTPLEGKNGLLGGLALADLEGLA